MNKICTSIEQSKKLIELGIDVETADMYYTSEHSTPSIMTGAKSDYSSYVPAWSLTALLELIPDMIEDYVLRIDKAEGEYFIWYDELGKGWSDAIVHPSSENFIDAAFKMICWLKENGKI